MPRILIDSLDDARLDPYRHLKMTNRIRRRELFIAEGRKVVRRLAESDFEMESVLVSDRREAEVAEYLPPEVPLLVMPLGLAQQLVGYNFHAGVLGCGRRQPSPLLADVVDSHAGRLTIVACPDVQGPENMGAIIRLCSGFGVQALLIGRECVDPFSRRVLRVSMGTAFRLPIIQSDDLAGDLIRLHEAWDFELAATVLNSSAERLADASRPQRFGLLFGNEAHGLGKPWLGLCQRQLTIPMHDADSLNVAVAAGIILHYFTQMA